MLDDVRKAVGKEAPDIVNPVIDKAEADGKITAAQAKRLHDTVANLVAGPPRRPPAAPRPARRGRARGHPRCLRGPCRADVDIAKPIIDEAVADKKITQAQSDQITDILGHKPSSASPARAGTRSRPRAPASSRPLPAGRRPPPDQAPGSASGTPYVPSSPA